MRAALGIDFERAGLAALSARWLIGVGIAFVATSVRADFGTVTSVQVGPGEKARIALLGDFDGNGTADLLLASNVNGAESDRVVRYYARQAGDATFASTPFHEFRLTRDVVGIGVADVHPSPGDELLLFFGRAVLAYRWNVDPKDRYSKLADVQFLWQIPHPRTLFSWNEGVRDVDGDGLVDLVIPEPLGHRVLLQRRAGGAATFTDAVSFLALPRERLRDRWRRQFARGDSGSREVQIRFDLESDSGFRGPFLSVNEEIPVLRFIDWDGDGDQDGVSQNATSLLVWRQDKGGVFESQPGISLELPVDPDKTQYDVSYRAHVQDLDADGRADYVMLAGDSQLARKSKETRTQVLVYTQAATEKRAKKRGGDEKPLFGAAGVPAQLLVLSGFAGGSHFADVDGDGRDDFVVGSLRLDLLARLRDSIQDQDSVETELYVFRNLGGTFSERPDVSHSIKLSADDLDGLGDELVARFFGDITGDGTSELLVRSTGKKVKIFMVRNRKGNLQLIDRALFSLDVDEDAEVSLARPTPDGPPELLVLEEGGVRHVRFR